MKKPLAILVKTVSPTESAYQTAVSYLAAGGLSFSSKLGDGNFSVKNGRRPVGELGATYAVEESQASSIGNMAWAVCYQSCGLSRHCFHNTNQQPRSWALSSPLDLCTRMGWFDSPPEVEKTQEKTRV